MSKREENKEKLKKAFNLISGNTSIDNNTDKSTSNKEKTQFESEAEQNGNKVSPNVERKSSSGTVPSKEASIKPIEDNENVKSKRKSKKGKVLGFGSSHIEDLKLSDIEKKGNLQNLDQRGSLLKILATLFSIQLLFMNVIVLLVVCWVTLDIKFFKSVDSQVLEVMVSFMKYYITAILAELLGAIVFITHQVFTKK